MKTEKDLGLLGTTVSGNFIDPPSTPSVECCAVHTYRVMHRVCADCEKSRRIATREMADLLLPPLRAIAKSKGYCLLTHGSLARDIDLVAVPWGHEAETCDALTIAETIRAETERVTGKTAFWINDENAKPHDYTRRNPEPKFHGRLGWSIHIAGTGTYLDLSVMPPLPSPPRDVATDSTTSKT